MIEALFDQQAGNSSRELPTFRDGQVLLAEDLRREDQYRHRAMREHQARVHSAGIVSGLWLHPLDKERIRITPGMAVDGRGRMILVPNETIITACALAEVWIAFKESPPDSDDSPTPNTPPARYSPGFEILFREAGVCREETSDAVYLGMRYAPEINLPEPLRRKFSRARSHVDDTQFPAESGIWLLGRRYVGAVGGSIEAPSRTSRILLGPEKPLDPRVFAISTRRYADTPYADHLTVESGGILHLHSPSQMKLGVGQESRRRASLQLGYRHLEFRTSDLPAPNRLADQLLRSRDDWFQPYFSLDDTARKVAEEFVRRPSLSQCECQAIANVLCERLNELIKNACLNSSTDEFFKTAFDKRNTLDLREGTRDLLRAQQGGSFQPQPGLLMRLLLEDLFHPLLRRSDVNSWAKRTLEFRGARPPAKGARPGEFYLSRIETDEGFHEELRLEIHHPGKENNPERFRALVRATKDIPPAEEDSPLPDPKLKFCLSIDASRTVTIPCLKVFPSSCAAESHLPKSKVDMCGFGRGLILKIDTEKESSDRAQVAEDLAQVAPWDLVMHDIGLAKAPTEAKFKLKLKLENTGKGEIHGVQLHVLIFSTDSPVANPIRETVLRDVVLPAGAIADYVANPLEILYGVSDIVDHTLNAHLLALGAGPGGTVAEEKRTIPVT